jgi:cytochrome P450
MSSARAASARGRNRHGLPPSVPHPALIQTLGCRIQPYAYLEYCHARLGDRFTLYPLDVGPLTYLSDPEDIRAVLTGDPSCLHPGAGASMIAPLVGETSFMLIEEDEHLCGRRAISPAFNLRAAQDHASTVAELVDREIATWPLDVVVALHPKLCALVLRMMLNVIFGDLDDAILPLRDSLIEMLTVTASLVLQEPRLRHLPGWQGTWKRFLRQRREVDTLLYAIIDRRRADGETRSRDVLDRLLEAKNPDGSPMCRRQIRDHLMSVILAGHETTAGELAWAFQLLAHNPGKQARLSEEIRNGTEAEYLTAIFNETLRHKPVFMFAIPRRVVKPIEIHGWTYRPPAQLLACTYLLHHNPELYRDPHAFRPERFIEETQTPHTWLPWGGGRKHCLGRHFAAMEVKAVVREVISRRHVLPAAPRIERPQWRSVIVVPGAGCRVILRHRP